MTMKKLVNRFCIEFSLDKKWIYGFVYPINWL